MFKQNNEDEAYLEEREYEEAIRGGISLRQPFPRYKKANEFKKNYFKIGLIIL